MSLMYSFLPDMSKMLYFHGLEPYINSKIHHFYKFKVNLKFQKCFSANHRQSHWIYPLKKYYME